MPYFYWLIRMIRFFLFSRIWWRLSYLFDLLQLNRLFTLFLALNSFNLINFFLDLPSQYYLILRILHWELIDRMHSSTQLQMIEISRIWKTLLTSSTFFHWRLSGHIRVRDLLLEIFRFFGQGKTGRVHDVLFSHVHLELVFWFIRRRDIWVSQGRTSELFPLVILLTRFEVNISQLWMDLLMAEFAFDSAIYRWLRIFYFIFSNFISNIYRLDLWLFFLDPWRRFLLLRDP